MVKKYLSVASGPHERAPASRVSGIEEGASVALQRSVCAAYVVSGLRTGWVVGEHRRSGRLTEVSSPRLFETRHRSLQPRLFGLDDVLGESGWAKAIRLEDYAARRDTGHHQLQPTLFTEEEAS